MGQNKFPYGNDLKSPDVWAGLANTLSSSWLIGYHSGVSLIVGHHTFLLFGRESLSAAVVSFVGAGATATYGLAKAAKKIERSGGNSARVGGNGSMSEKLERVEKIKDAKDAKDQITAGDDLNSAVGIYNVLHAQTNGMTSLKPFCMNDLNYTSGWVSGAGVDVLIGGATYYLADARDLFKGVNVFNISGSETLVSASLGSMIGFWRIKKFYSLWNELAHSSKEEYPFQMYNVHPFFREWKSAEYSYEKQLDKISQQDRIIGDIRSDMIANPKKYGYPDSAYALKRSVEMTDILSKTARDPKQNPFMPWIPMDKQHIFY